MKNEWIELEQLNILVEAIHAIADCNLLGYSRKKMKKIADKAIIAIRPIAEPEALTHEEIHRVGKMCGVTVEEIDALISELSDNLKALMPSAAEVGKEMADVMDNLTEPQGLKITIKDDLTPLEGIKIDISHPPTYKEIGRGTIHALERLPDGGMRVHIALNDGLSSVPLVEDVIICRQSATIPPEKIK